MCVVMEAFRRQFKIQDIHSYLSRPFKRVNELTKFQKFLAIVVIIVVHIIVVFIILMLVYKSKLEICMQETYLRLTNEPRQLLRAKC